MSVSSHSTDSGSSHWDFPCPWRAFAPERHDLQRQLLCIELRKADLADSMRFSRDEADTAAYRKVIAIKGKGHSLFPSLYWISPVRYAAAKT